jgi:DNA replication protein DnaC
MMDAYNNEQDKFPEALLHMSDDDRLRYFKEQIIAHPKLENALNKAYSLVTGQAGPDIMIVTGPSGVGKTTLLKLLEDKILEDHAERMQVEKDFMPVIRINACAPLQKQFKWSDFYTRLLLRMDEPTIQYKLPLGYSMYDLIDSPRDLISKMATPEALQRCAENCLHYRKTKVLLIDEASVMLLKGKDSSPDHLFELIKTLSINSGAQIVLCGTYRLLEILELSPQLIRRSRIVHMERYSNGLKDDKRKFVNVLRSFGKKLPMVNAPNLASHADSFYLKSVGCIGILHDLLVAWFDNALKTGVTSVEYDFLNSLITNFSIKRVLEEAIAGEQKLRDIPLDTIRKMLQEHNMGLQPDKGKTEITSGKRGKNSNGVGNRNPKRDPVGDNHVLF